MCGLGNVIQMDKHIVMCLVDMICIKSNARFFLSWFTCRKYLYYMTSRSTSYFWFTFKSLASYENRQQQYCQPQFCVICLKPLDSTVILTHQARVLSNKITSSSITQWYCWHHIVAIQWNDPTICFVHFDLRREKWKIDGTLRPVQGFGVHTNESRPCS